MAANELLVSELPTTDPPDLKTHTHIHRREEGNNRRGTEHKAYLDSVSQCFGISHPLFLASQIQSKVGK